MSSQNATFQQVRAVIKALMGQANTITIPRELVRFFDGDYVAAGMMSQLIYWDDKTTDPDGWIYKTAEQWNEELCLSPYQIRRGAEVLGKRGFAARTFRKNRQYRNGTTPVWHYLADMDTFIAEFTQFLEVQQTRPSTNYTREVQQTATSVIEETATSSIDTKPTIHQPTTTNLQAGGATAPGGGGSPGDCSWKTETYRYLMQIHHQYPTVFKQPNGKNAKKYAELPLALVQKITEECVAHGLGTGMLMNKLQGALDFPPPPPVEAAPADDTPEPEVIPPPFMPMDEWAQIVSPFEREVWALTVYRDGVLTTDSTLDRHINYDYAARRDRILARIGGGA